MKYSQISRWMNKGLFGKVASLKINSSTIKIQDQGLGKFIFFSIIFEFMFIFFSIIFEFMHGMNYDFCIGLNFIISFYSQN